jgi:hypothetical protein
LGVDSVCAATGPAVTRRVNNATAHAKATLVARLKLVISMIPSRKSING